MSASPLRHFAQKVLLPIGTRIEAAGLRATPATSDCIIVPGAWVSAEGVPSDTLVWRVERALSILHLASSGHVIFTGGSVQSRAVESDVALRLAEERGFDVRHGVLERSSRNTFENLMNAKRIMRDRGWRTAIICTDAVHVPRCLWLARDVGLEASAAPLARHESDEERRRRDGMAKREAIAVFGYFAFWPYFQVRNRL